jgi:hypothetical protein
MNIRVPKSSGIFLTGREVLACYETPYCVELLVRFGTPLALSVIFADSVLILYFINLKFPINRIFLISTTRKRVRCQIVLWPESRGGGGGHNFRNSKYHNNF